MDITDWAWQLYDIRGQLPVNDDPPWRRIVFPCPAPQESVSSPS
ncbi:hypothetical protein ABZT28_49325 [Streptomyces sp. NPDC005388]